MAPGGTQPNPSVSARMLAMLGIALVNMLIALDQTVVSTALPSIVADLKGFEFYAWVATAYLLASVVTVPVFGRLGDYFGRKRFVLAAIGSFTAASMLCGLAPDMRFLVVARALQGVGAGMMVGTAFASIADLFPDPHTRVRWQVIIAMSYGIGTAAGPSLGGWLSQHFGWRSTFLINLPVGLAALYFVAAHLPRFVPERREAVRIDWLGALLIGLLLGSLQGLIEALPEGGFGAQAWRLAILAVIFLGAGGALLVCERRATHPIIPLGLFRDPALVTLFILSVLAGFVMFSLIFFAPLLLQGGFGLSPQSAGLLATPIAACIALGSFCNTAVMTRLKRPTRVLQFGFSMLLLASLGLSLASHQTPHLFLELALGAVGIGLGFILNNLNIFGQEIAGRNHLGIITALMQSTRMVGGMLGTTIVATLINQRYAAGVADALSTLRPQQLSSWLPRVSDPRILVDEALRSEVVAALVHASINGDGVIEAARRVLVQSIHVGAMFTGCAALVGVLLVRRVSHIRLRQVRPAAADAPLGPH